jgi:tetratricopeptide (TPR) repeat protein
VYSSDQESLERDRLFIAPLLATFALLAPPATRTTFGSSPDLVKISRAMSAIDAAEQRGQIAAERKRWSWAAAAQPRDVAAHFLATYAAPRDEDAWKAFRILGAEFPKSALGPIGMACVYLEWGILDQVDVELASALSIEPANWLVLRVRAMARERRDHLGAARSDYEAVLRNDPQCAAARVSKRSGDPLGARRQAEAALAVAPGDGSALALLAELAIESGERERAAVLFSRALEARPRDRVLHVSLARLLAERGDLRPALEHWQIALSQEEDAESLQAVAEISRKLGRTTLECGALERLTRIVPSAVAAWRRLAEIRMAAGEIEAAEVAWRQVVTREPHEPSDHLALARLYRSRGEGLSAIAEYRAAGPVALAERVQTEKRFRVERLSRRSIAELERAVAKLADRVYRDRLRESPRLSGRLRFQVTVDSAGAATIIDVLEDTVQDRAVLGCAYWNLNDAIYPKNRPGRYQFSFAFKPSRR